MKCKESYLTRATVDMFYSFASGIGRSDVSTGDCLKVGLMKVKQKWKLYAAKFSKRLV